MRYAVAVAIVPHYHRINEIPYYYVVVVVLTLS